MGEFSASTNEYAWAMLFVDINRIASGHTTMTSGWFKSQAFKGWLCKYPMQYPLFGTSRKVFNHCKHSCDRCVWRRFSGETKRQCTVPTFFDSVVENFDRRNTPCMAIYTHTQRGKCWKSTHIRKGVDQLTLLWHELHRVRCKITTPTKSLQSRTVVWSARCAFCPVWRWHLSDTRIRITPFST